MSDSSPTTLSNESPKPKRRWFQFSLRTLLVMMLLCGCVVLCGCFEIPRIVSPEEKLPYEERLARIDGVGNDAREVARYRGLLSQLDNKYVDTKFEIMVSTMATRDILNGVGISVSLLDLMQGMNKIFPAKVENQKYPKYIAAYLTLRTNGESHEQAIDEIASCAQP